MRRLVAGAIVLLGACDKAEGRSPQQPYPSTQASAQLQAPTASHAPVPSARAATVPPADLLAQAYSAYIAGDLGAAKLAFQQLAPGPHYPLTKIQRGAAVKAVTAHYVVGQAATGLLAIDRASLEPVAFRGFEHVVSTVQGLRSHDQLIVTTDAARRKVGERYRLLVLDARTLTTRRDLPAGAMFETNPPAVSRSGRLVAYVDPDGSVRLLQAGNLKPVTSFEADSTTQGNKELVFAPDDNSLLVAERDDAAKNQAILTLSLLAVPSGATLWRHEPRGQQDLTWRFGPRVPCLELNDDGTRHAIDTETGKAVKTCPTGAALEKPIVPEQLARRLAARYCFDGRAIVPAALRPCP